MAKKHQAIEVSKEQIEAKEFKALHRHSEKFFTRDRRLPFSLVLVLVLRNSVKSLQNVVNEAICEEFGTIAWTNGKTAEIQGERPYALALVLYDVLNKVALDATLGKAKAYEIDLAIEHLSHTKAGDLMIMDRNYPSYRMLAEICQFKRNFVVRCSSASFSPCVRIVVASNFKKK